MPNPRGINQYTKGGGGGAKKKRVTGTFAHGTKSATSSNAGHDRGNSRADALKSARLAKKNAAKKKR